MFCLSWSARTTRNTSHNTWPHFHTHVVSFQKSLLQICQVWRRIWCLLCAPVSRPCWNRKCEGIHGDKHSCCETPNVHTATPLGTLSGDVPCSQAQRTHSCSAIRWRSVELVWELFDTPTYKTTILPVVLYWHKTQVCHIMGWMQSEGVKEWGLRTLFVPKKEKVIGDWVKLSNVTYQDLYSLPDIFRLNKSREWHGWGM